MLTVPHELARLALQSAPNAMIITNAAGAIRELPSDPDLKVASKPLKAEDMLTLMDASA